MRMGIPGMSHILTIRCFILAGLLLFVVPARATQQTVYDMYGIDIKHDENIARADELFYDLRGDRKTGDASYYCKVNDVNTSQYAHAWFLEAGKTSRFAGIGVTISNGGPDPLYFQYDQDEFYVITKDNAYHRVDIIVPQKGQTLKIINPHTALSVIFDQNQLPKDRIKCIVLKTNYGRSLILLKWVVWEE